MQKSVYVHVRVCVCLSVSLCCVCVDMQGFSVIVDGGMGDPFPCNIGKIRWFSPRARKIFWDFPTVFVKFGFPRGIRSLGGGTKFFTRGDPPKSWETGGGDKFLEIFFEGGRDRGDSPRPPL